MNLLETAGSRDNKENRWAPIFTNRFFMGMWTNRNTLRAPTGIIYENYYKIGGTDALLGGTNVEVSNRLTLIRRPGCTAGLSGILTSANVPDVIDSFYSFHEIGGAIRVFADTPTAPYLITSSAVIPIFTKAAGVTQSFFQGIGQSLYISDAKEQQKWLDFGVGNPGNSFATVTNVALTSNVATITSANNFVVGQTVVVSGTATTSGLFNTTAVITSANTNQFTFALTHANVGSTPDTGFANATWNWQISPPTVAPTLNIVASGAAAATWVGSTVYTTMGLLVDANGNVQQIVSVNATGTNVTQLGTTSNGEPAWNPTPGATTTDGTITWTNWGPCVLWSANKLFLNASVGGTLTNPAFIYDPTSATFQWNTNGALASGTSGGTKPNFVAVQNTHTFDPPGSCPPGVTWDSQIPNFGTANGNVSKWKASTAYAAGANILEPYVLPPPANQTVFIQHASGGTSGASGTAPSFATTAGQPITDGDLVWLCLGSATWAATTSYTQWTGTNPVFGTIKDTNGNMQVCTVSGKSGSTQPFQAWQANHAYSNTNIIVDSNGNKQTVTSPGTSGAAKTLTTSVLASRVATYTTSTNHGYTTGQFVTVTGSTHNATFNVVNAIIASTPTAATFTITLAHDDIGSAADVGSVFAGPTWNTVLAGTTTDGGVTWTNGGTATGWGVNYGDQTTEGGVTWRCVGPPMTWAASTQWYLPPTGFAPPSSSQPYGGVQIIGSAFVQTVISSGKSASTPQPTWSTTIGNFVLDPSTSNTGITWRNIAAQSTSSLAFAKGYGYVFAYKARTTVDLYAPGPAGGGVLLGQSASTPSPLISQGTTPTGSADGSVSTASPSVQMAVGANAGAVVNISGLGSLDPQVDTISIFRTVDGGATFFWLTDIKNPQPIGGVAQAWSYADTLPDFANATASGLNVLVLAPIAHQGDPPLAGAINLVQHFGRIFYSVGSTVYASQGPLVGGANQPPGNGYTSFNPAYFWTLPSPVTRLVATRQGLLVFTSSDLFVIEGGPSITTLFANIFVPGLGLTNYNALTVQGGLIFVFTADNQVISLDPNMGVSKIGYAIGDQFSKFNGVTSAFAPNTSYLAFHIQGLMDEALFVADGSTGWFRCNINQAPDSSISGPVWSPKANVVGGCKAIASLEVALGQHALLVGSTTANRPVLVRDSTFSTFADNGSAYASNCILGNIILASPGQLAELGFVTCEYTKTGTSPKLLALMNETQDTLITISAASQSGSTTTYTYTLVSGPDVVGGIILTITGMADSGNNGVFTVNTGGGGTFAVTNPSGVTRAAQTGTGTRFEDLSAYISAVTGLPPQDPPLIYGLNSTPTTTFSNRYFFAQSVGGQVPPFGTSCRYLQFKLDFGSTDTVMNELLTQTIWGAHWQEN